MVAQEEQSLCLSCMLRAPTPLSKGVKGMGHESHFHCKWPHKLGFEGTPIWCSARLYAVSPNVPYCAMENVIALFFDFEGKICIRPLEALRYETAGFLTTAMPLLITNVTTLLRSIDKPFPTFLKKWRHKWDLFVCYFRITIYFSIFRS